MNTWVMISVAMMMGSSVIAAFKSDKVVVCLEGNAPTENVNALTANSSKLFRTAGIKLEWHADPRPCRRERDPGIVVSLSTSTPKSFHPGALACAYPYEGVHVQVFFDRIALADPELLPYLLAHVVVHEVTHIIQGIDRHSAIGIMKAQWNSYDFTQMKRGQLQFTNPDIEMIHDGLAARASGAHGGIGTVANAAVR